jgi:hypothetical protein
VILLENPNEWNLFQAKLQILSKYTFLGFTGLV